ncbi:helix-turn-helix domain-containing protein [Streptomyces sp. NPDC004609]|uniref:AraC-like ligand-binding domain-containing protein n=1 Tax=Streptomyces sp. NPDC004609 TaxID=3364704 RepID=UPI0036C31285
MESVFRGEELDRADRFECWRELACEAHAPTDVTSEHAADFRASMGVMSLGAVRVSAYDHPPLRARRTAGLVRRSDPELYLLCLVVEGQGGFVQAGREAVLEAGDLWFASTSLPYKGWLGSDGRRVAMKDILLPRALLPLPSGRADRLIGKRISGRDGIGALLAQFLTGLVAQPSLHGRPSDSARLGTVVLDLSVALLGHHLGTSAAPEAHPQALAVRIDAFVHQHLGDPRLGPETVARAHHISTRSLNRHFQRRGTTVSAYIRELRLDRVRRDLADPRLSARSIHSIAARWGFPQHAHFSRAFRTAYGITPSEHRDNARRGAAGAESRPSRPAGRRRPHGPSADCPE